MVRQDYVSRLDDAIIAKGREPVAETERLAQEALTRGFINEKHYYTLKHRVPFSDSSYQTLKNVGQQFKVGEERARQLQWKAYYILQEYFNATSGNLSNDTLIDSLPIDFRKETIVAAIKMLFGKTPTICELIQFLEENSNTGRIVNLDMRRSELNDFARIMTMAGFPSPKVKFRTHH